MRRQSSRFIIDAGGTAIGAIAIGAIVITAGW